MADIGHLKVGRYSPYQSRHNPAFIIIWQVTLPYFFRLKWNGLLGGWRYNKNGGYDTTKRKTTMKTTSNNKFLVF